MSIHGKAKLTLTDPKTGLVLFKEEHKNAITPALARIFGSNLGGCLNYNKIMPVLSKLLGGVCLFNGTVNASDVFLPTAQAAQLTAHAGQNTSFDAATDAKRGFINTALCGPIENGYRWTWQWTTTGNGPITDIVLTHADTGDFWNESTPNVMASDFSPVGDVNNGVVDPSEFEETNTGGYWHIEGQQKIPLGFIDDANRVVTVEVDDGKLIVHVGKFTGSGAWIWNNLCDIEDEQTFEWTPTPFVWGTFESLGICCFYIALDAVNKKVYTFNAGSLDGEIYRNRSQVLTVNTLDLETGTTSNTTINCSATLGAFSQYANKSPDKSGIDAGAAFYIQGVANNNEGLLKQVQIIDGSVILPVYWFRSGLGAQGGNTDCSIRVNLTNTTDQEIIKGFYDIEYTFRSKDLLQVDLGNGRIMNMACMAWKDGSGDYKAQEISADASIVFDDYYSNRGYCASVPGDIPVQFMAWVSPTQDPDAIRGCILNKLYAATVFHIENGPVVKSANLNMTLEYEITQEVNES